MNENEKAVEIFVRNKWLTVTEMSKIHGISRHKIEYWLTRLNKAGQAYKTNSGRGMWLIHIEAVRFLSTKQKPGRKRYKGTPEERERWRRIYTTRRSVNGVAIHFGVCWQTAARRLDLYGIRPYKKRAKRIES